VLIKKKIFILKARDLGVKKHFRKPFDKDDLRDAIREVIFTGDSGVSNSLPKKRDNVNGIIDRFVGELAVITIDGVISNFPKEILPKEAEVGDVINIQVTLLKS
jgi:hypothetical protein